MVNPVGTAIPVIGQWIIISGIEIGLPASDGLSGAWHLTHFCLLEAQEADVRGTTRDGLGVVSESDLPRQYTTKKVLRGAGSGCGLSGNVRAFQGSNGAASAVRREFCHLGLDRLLS